MIKINVRLPGREEVFGWYLLSASEYREEMGHCFESWAKITGTEGAAY
jgi:hypothetical protein